MAGQLDVICATSAFGMGIYKADIRVVIHYHLPTTLADYVQEIGRAGRDGQPALAMMLYVPGDEQLVRSLNDLTAATPNEIARDRLRFEHKQPPATPVSEVLQFYWQRGESVDKVTDLFGQRQRAKERELNALMNYVNTPTCRRAVMLAYFDEQAPVHTTTCCQLPGDSLPISALGLTVPSVTEIEPITTWSRLLAQLFLPNS